MAGVVHMYGCHMEAMLDQKAAEGRQVAHTFRTGQELCSVIGRAEESAKPEGDRLFHDPFARALAGSAGLEFLRELSTVEGTTYADQVNRIAVRTAYLDALVVEYCVGGVGERNGDKGDGGKRQNTAKGRGSGLRTRSTRRLALKGGGAVGPKGPPQQAEEGVQLVMLGVGCDTRAYRLPLPGVTVFELDFDEVLLHRKCSLDGVPPTCQLAVEVPVDLLRHPEWQAALCSKGFDPSVRSVWVLEGLLMYFAPAQVDRLLGCVSDLSCSSSRLVFNAVPPECLATWGPYYE
eukprot:gene4060-4402_t